MWAKNLANDEAREAAAGQIGGDNGSPSARLPSTSAAPHFFEGGLVGTISNCVWVKRRRKLDSDKVIDCFHEVITALEVRLFRIVRELWPTKLHYRAPILQGVKLLDVQGRVQPVGEATTARSSSENQRARKGISPSELHGTRDQIDRFSLKAVTPRSHREEGKSKGRGYCKSHNRGFKCQALFLHLRVMPQTPENVGRDKGTLPRLILMASEVRSVRRRSTPLKLLSQLSAIWTV